MHQGGIVMGILIAVEGVDGSGKQTQSDLLEKNLNKSGFDVQKIAFPNYESKSSVLVKMYLMGEFSPNPKDISAYQASTFFAADRYASWMTGEWKAHYLKGGIVLADRYTTANMVHQAGKIKNQAERDRYLEWLYDFEFNLYGIPVPDLVFFLDVPPFYQQQNVRSRKNKITGGSEQDIHEASLEHLKESYEAAIYVAKKYGWIKIDCIKNQKMRSIEDIGQEILSHALDRIGDLKDKLK
jgi:dTMP kinase